MIFLKQLLLSLSIILLAGGASALSNYGGGSWSNYKDIIINNTGGALTDYQVLVSLDNSNFPTNAQSSGADIRFMNATGTELSYWIEKWDNTNKVAKIWVKVPSIAAGGGTTIYMWYGNPSAISSSNGNATFLFFDDFEKYTGINDPNFLNVWERFNNQGGSSIENGRLHMWSTAICCNGQTWITKADFPKNIRAKFELRYNEVQDWYNPRGIAAFLRSLHNYQTYASGLPDFFIGCCSGGQTVLWGDSLISVGGYTYNDAFHSTELTAFGNNMSLYRDGLFLGSVNITQYDRTGAFGFYVHGDGDGADDIYFDNVRLAQYTSPEPSVIVGATHQTDIKIAIILAEPSDDPHNIIHDKNYYLTKIIPDIKDYYNEVSYGSVNIVINPEDVYDNNSNWYKLGKTAAYYGRNITYPRTNGTTYEDGSDNSSKFLLDVVETVDNDVNFTEYDAVVIVHSNKSQQETGGNWDLMTTHAWMGDYTTSNGDTAKNLILNSEYELMGTWAHETGHALGRILQPFKPPFYLPDRYGDSNGNHSIGNWDLMGSGNWLGVPAGSNPDHMSSFSKDWLGWLNNKSVGYGTYWINSLATMNYGDETTRYITKNITYTNYLNYYIIETRTNNPAYSRWDISAPIPYGYNNSLVLYQVADYGKGNSTVDYINNLIPWKGTPYADYSSYWDFASKLHFMALDERARTVGTKPLLEMEVGIDNFSIPWLVGAILEPRDNLLGYVPWYSWSSSLNSKTPLPDIDLHAYTPDGKHVGINYTSGIYENEIPGANASGDLLGREWIFVLDDVKVQFVVDSRDNQNFLNSYPGLQQITNGTQSYNLTLVYDVPNDIRYAASIEQSIQPGDVNKYNYSIAMNTDGTYKVIVDDVPPTTTALLSGVMGNNGWYISNVQVDLTTTDNEGGSGVNRSDFSFDGINWNTYSVPLTIANEGATTVYYRSVDNAGNVETTKTQGINIDKTPPQIAIYTPVNESVYILNQTLIANWSAYDSLSGIASATGTVSNGLTIDTGIVGAKIFNVAAADNASNTADQNTFYIIAYNYLGILPPIRADNSSIFKSGSTVPVKFRIVDANGNNVSTAVANLTYQKITGDILGTVEEPFSTSAVDSGNTFRYDDTDNLYIFNLGTSGMDKGTYQLNINLDDGTVRTVCISIKL